MRVRTSNLDTRDTSSINHESYELIINKTFFPTLPRARGQKNKTVSRTRVSRKSVQLPMLIDECFNRLQSVPLMWSARFVI